MTGGASTAEGRSHAFLWDGSTMVDLGTLGVEHSYGTAINASGQVTGTSYTGPDTFLSQHAFLWDGNTMQDLGTRPGGVWSEAFDINASGQVTGQSGVFEDAHAFLWDGTTMLDLGGIQSVGVAINDAGQVTGGSDTFDEPYAFLWDGTTLQDLNALIDLADPLRRYVTLEFGFDINDLGQILAHGIDSRTGEFHAYVVSPFSVSAPGTLALLGLGLLGLGAMRRWAA